MQTFKRTIVHFFICLLKHNLYGFQTVEQRERSERMKLKRERQMAERLAKVRKRKKLLPAEDQSTFILVIG